MRRALLAQQARGVAQPVYLALSGMAARQVWSALMALRARHLLPEASMCFPSPRVLWTPSASAAQPEDFRSHSLVSVRPCPPVIQHVGHAC
jgi:hypothetical protein